MMEPGASTHTSDLMKECVRLCTECHTVCTQTIAYCLQQGGRYGALDVVRILQDCSQLCPVSADSMLRDSPFSPRVCGLCATVCDACAASCDQFADDSQMRLCTDTCRRCADCCRKMAA
jgi:hypothetical protein